MKPVIGTINDSLGGEFVITPADLSTGEAQELKD
jgi:hypothetical protein